MRLRFLSPRTILWFCALVAALSFGSAFLTGKPAASSTTLKKLSHDPFTNTTSQHETEVEPDSFAYGTTIVDAFQTGRFFDGGSSDIGFATSTDSGLSWHHGFLPGITKIQNPANPYDRASDPSVAYDAGHNEWMIESLPLSSTLPSTPAVLVSRSTDGLIWQNPVGIAPNSTSSDKPWIVCDNWSTSRFHGRCYVEWDNFGNGDQIEMSVTKDGGATWSPPRQSSGSAFGLGGQPLVQPDGKVVVPYLGNGGPIEAIASTDGGKTWSPPVTVATVSDHGEAGGLRSGPLPSAEEDGTGRVYVAWQDCRFRLNCQENDIVFSTSADGVTWSAPSRVPIDPTTSTVDHFIPGIAADPATGGPTAHIAVTFYYYPQTSCSTTTCKLGVGFIASHDGGATWLPASAISPLFHVTHIASTSIGRMVGDYISTSFSHGMAFGVFAVAQTPSGNTFNEAMYTPAGGLAVPSFGFGTSSQFDRPYPNAHSDHPRRRIPPKTMKHRIEGD